MNWENIVSCWDSTLRRNCIGRQGVLESVLGMTGIIMRMLGTVTVQSKGGLQESRWWDHFYGRSLVAASNGIGHVL